MKVTEDGTSSLGVVSHSAGYVASEAEHVL